MKTAKRTPAWDVVVHFYETERPLPLDGLFQRRAPRVLEIGSGLGDYLVPRAADQPETDFIGLEIDWQRLKKSLRRVRVYRELHGAPLANIRFLKVDARVALRRLFVEQSFDEIVALFPCPWPKEKHHKHRLFDREFFRLLNSRLRPAGRVLIVTDHEEYFAWMRAQVPDDLFAVRIEETEPRFQTKFEKKWVAQGRSRFYECRLTKTRHVGYAVDEDVPMQTHFIPDCDWRGEPLPDLKAPSVTVVFKEALWDSRIRTGMLHWVVAEPVLTQHVWMTLRPTSKGWVLEKTAGHTVLPTPGVALALKHTAEVLRHWPEGKREKARGSGPRHRVDKK